MNDKILKYMEFITEEMNDTPETYIYNKLIMIQKSINDLFENTETDDNEDIETISIRQAKEQKKKNVTFGDLNINLESSEVSKYSESNDSLTIKFSDQESTYNLLVSINIKDGMPTDPSKSFSEDDIKKCYIKFKKYNLDTMELYGQITKNVEMESGKNGLKVTELEGQEGSASDESLNIEDFLINLKIEIDDKFGDSEEFEIET